MKNIVDDVHYSKSALKFIKTRNAKEKIFIREAIEKNRELLRLIEVGASCFSHHCSGDTEVSR